MTLDLMVKTLALSVAAFALTHFQIDVTDSLSLILGTIPALLALRLLGLGPALVVTTAASLYTALQWGHPYGLLTAPTEIIAIHLLRERIDNLAIADLIYWVCGGGILVAGDRKSVV